MGKGQGGKLPHRVLYAGSDDEILRPLVLEHQPHALHIVLCVAPVPFAVQVPQLELVLQAAGDPPGGAGDLPRHKVLPPSLRLVVEQNAVDREHAVGLPVLLHHPVPVLLGDGVGAVGVEGRGLLLGHLLHLPVQLRGGGLVEPACFLHAQNPDALQQAQYPQRVHIPGVLRHVEAHLHVALGRQVVHLLRLYQPQDTDDAAGIAQIPVVEGNFIQQMGNPVRVGQGRPPGHAVDLVPLLQQQLCQIGPVLTRYACYQRSLHM